MRSRSLFLSVWVQIGLAGTVLGARAPLDRAWIRADNDIQYAADVSGTSERVPDFVAHKLGALSAQWRDEAVKIEQNMGSAEAEILADQAFERGPVQAVKLAGGKRAYFIRFDLGHGIAELQFGVADPATGRVTGAWPTLYMKWVGIGAPNEFLRRPYVSLEDLDGDGDEELVVEEQVHNGNMYNAVVYRYFKIGSDLSLKQVLPLETRAWDIRSEDAGGGYILRRVERTANGLVLKVSLETGGKHLQVGSVELVRSRQDGTYTLAAHHCSMPSRCDVLVTSSDGSEDEFMADDVGFRY